MSLLKLPAEIISEIVGLIEDGAGQLDPTNHQRRALCALARTCRHLHALATRTLYSHIAFDVNQTISEDFERAALLLFACRSNPALVHRVCSARLRCWPDDRDREVRGESFSVISLYNEIISHLSKSHSLKDLSVQFARASFEKSIPALYNYDDGAFPSLVELALQLDHVTKDQWLPGEHLCRLARLPRLQKLVAMVPIADFQAAAAAPPSNPIPNLKELCFYAVRPVSPPVLSWFVENLPNLHELHSSVPGDAIQVDRKYADSKSSLGFDLVGPLEPASYSSTLQPVAETLVAVTLDLDNIHYPSHDGSVVNFESFSRLREMSISSALIFGPDSIANHCAGRQIWKLLPPFLESLIILFDTHQGLYWSLDEMRDHERRGDFAELWSRRLDDSNVAWLTQLLERRRNPGSSLRSIEARETEVVDRDPNWKLAFWPGPQRLRDLASSSAVKLELCIRVPFKFQSDEFTTTEEPWHYGSEGTVVYNSE
ncbi:hypothetical protein BX600DRAFT_474809 [Xylariales sp. PMI_506]|nr:hypothetical protein BX600DRAFT_474809 [Xylariales sp. PMI_506]